jgi:hypothetical protein
MISRGQQQPKLGLAYKAVATSPAPLPFSHISYTAPRLPPPHYPTNFKDSSESSSLTLSIHTKHNSKCLQRRPPQQRRKPAPQPLPNMLLTKVCVVNSSTTLSQRLRPACDGFLEYLLTCCHRYGQGSHCQRKLLPSGALRMSSSVAMSDHATDN